MDEQLLGELPFGLELRHRLAYVCPHGLRRDEEPLADLLVREAVRKQAQDLALTLGQRGDLLGLRAHEDAGEDRVDVCIARRDPLDRSHEVGQGRLLEHETPRADVERLRKQRAVAVGRVEDDRRVRRNHCRLRRDLDPREPRHADVDDRDARVLRLDLDERFLAVGRAADDLDPAPLQGVRDRRQHRRMVVGNHAGDPLVHAGPSFLDVRDTEVSPFDSCPNG